MCDYKLLAEGLRYCSKHICSKECGYYEICHRDRGKEYPSVTSVGFDAADAIEELLAERNVAFWVDTQPHLDDANYKKDGMAYYCSNCHHRAGKYKHRSYKFCPWCGAKMVPKEMAVRNED